MATVRKGDRSFLPVFPSEGRKVIRRTTRLDAEKYEAQGLWCREYDTQSGELIGFRLVGAEVNKVDSDLQSTHTTAGISPSEMQLNVCHSRTYGMREVDRLALIKNGDLPEDVVERTQAKVRVYRLVGAAKGDILRRGR